MSRVVVRVPATTANLGPAFDVLGLALSLWLELSAEPAATYRMTLTGEGATEIATDESNLIAKSCFLAFEHAGKPVVPLAFRVHSDIPFGCGCGSSSAAAIAGYVAGAVLCGLQFPASSERLLQIIGELEGHPDNAAPAIYGGVQLSIYDGGKTMRSFPVPVPSDLACVLLVPTSKMKKNTHATRKLIPSELVLGDAVHNMSRTALLTLGFATNNTRVFQYCLDERIHQNRRAEALFPHLHATIAAAMKAGAAYAFLSGAGPTVCAFVQTGRGEVLLHAQADRRVEDVATAMRAAAAAAGVPGKAIVTLPSQVGAHIVYPTQTAAASYVKTVSRL